MLSIWQEQFLFHRHHEEQRQVCLIEDRFQLEWLDLNSEIAEIIFAEFLDRSGFLYNGKSTGVIASGLLRLPFYMDDN